MDRRKLEMMIHNSADLAQRQISFSHARYKTSPPYLQRSEGAWQLLLLGGRHVRAGGEAVARIPGQWPRAATTRSMQAPLVALGTLH